MTEDRRKGKSRRSHVDRRQGEQRVRQIPVAIERRKDDDRRSGVDRRTTGEDQDRRVASTNRP